MNRYYAVRYENGRHQVGVTTDGIDWIPLPRAAFETPRQAIRYADMRQAEVSPLRGVPEQQAAEQQSFPVLMGDSPEWREPSRVNSRVPGTAGAAEGQPGSTATVPPVRTI